MPRTANPLDLKIHKNQTAAMQSILLLVSRGYRFHTGGSVDTPKAPNLVRKFDERYDVIKSHQTKATRKREGRPAATLVMHPAVGGHRLDWALLATGALEGELMQDALNPTERLRWTDKYVLLQKPRTGNGLGWTWCMDGKYLNDLESRFIFAGRKANGHELQALIDVTTNMPMFNGVRENLKKARRRGIDVFRKQNPRAEFPNPKPLPSMTRRIQGYDNPPLTLGTLLEARQHRLDALQKTLDENYV